MADAAGMIVPALTQLLGGLPDPAVRAADAAAGGDPCPSLRPSRGSRRRGPAARTRPRTLPRAGGRAGVLEPFRTTKSSGTGLGLPIALRIVEAHRGRLTVKSTPGSETVFRVELALAR